MTDKHKNPGLKKLKFFHNKNQEQRQDEKLKAVVTDHAVVRYLQRVYGLDVNLLRTEILGNCFGMINTMQTGKIQHGDIVLIFVDGKVITVKTKRKI